MHLSLLWCNLLYLEPNIVEDLYSGGTLVFLRARASRDGNGTCLLEVLVIWYAEKGLSFNHRIEPRFRRHAVQSGCCSLWALQVFCLLSRCARGFYVHLIGMLLCRSVLGKKRQVCFIPCIIYFNSDENHSVQWTSDIVNRIMHPSHWVANDLILANVQLSMWWKRRGSSDSSAYLQSIPCEYCC